MNEVLIIRQPQSEDEFNSMYDLRWRILRKPWNQPKGSEKDEKESEALHFIAKLDDRVVGTARFDTIKDRIGQIRYLAVDESFQRRGIGTNLLSSIHITARNRRFLYIILNARESAVKFFEKLGYSIMEDGPILFDVIKHFKMVKKLC